MLRLQSIALSPALRLRSRARLFSSLRKAASVGAARVRCVGRRAYRSATASSATASEGMSPVQKAGWTLVGTGALAGIGFVSFQGQYLYSETAQNDELRKRAGIPYPPYMKQRLEETYGYIVSGLGITGATAALALRSAGMGVMLSPVGFLGGQIILRAAVGTGLMVGSIASVAMTAPSESFLWMAAPLNMGLGVVVLSSFGSFFFPASPILHNIVLYGGLGLFGGYVLYDTQKLQYNAQHKKVYSPMNEGFGLYLDTINIFIRLAQILAMQQGGGKRR